MTEPKDFKSRLFALYNRDKKIARDHGRDTKRFDRAMGIATSGEWRHPRYYVRYKTTINFCDCKDFTWRSSRLGKNSGISTAEAISRLAEAEPCKHVIVEQWLRELNAMQTSDTGRPPAHPGRMTSAERILEIFRDNFVRFKRMWRSAERRNDLLREAVEEVVPVISSMVLHRIPKGLPISIRQGDKMRVTAMLDYLGAVRTGDNTEVVMHRDAYRIIDSLVANRYDIHVAKVASGCSCKDVVNDNPNCMLHSGQN
jgi:hypothetical protein